jgi:hypothetical protein
MRSQKRVQPQDPPSISQIVVVVAIHHNAPHDIERSLRNIILLLNKLAFLSKRRYVQERCTAYDTPPSDSRLVFVASFLLLSVYRCFPA